MLMSFLECEDDELALAPTMAIAVRVSVSYARAEFTIGFLVTLIAMIV